jgi:hypothetical protein
MIIIRTHSGYPWGAVGQTSQPPYARYRNEGRFARSDVVVKDGYVTTYDKVRDLQGMNWVNFRVTAMKKVALDSVERGRVCDEPTFYGEIVRRRQLRAFEAKERFYEIGSESSLREFAEFIQSLARSVPGYPLTGMQYY